MMARASFSLVWCGLLACTGQPKPLDPAPQPQAVEGLAPAPETAVIPVDTTKVPPTSVALSTIGLARRPQIGAEARKANRTALKAHKKQDYVASREGFSKAVELSPDHDMARYNLACALSRLGRLDEAAAELTTLLHRDLHRFGPRWREGRPDPDLELLRGSKQGATIDALLPGLSAAYDQAHDAGVPAYMYRHTRRYVGFPPNAGPDEDDYDNYHEQGGTIELVAGIYVHDVGRFIPLTRGGDVALLDLPRRRALHVETSIWEGESHMMMHGRPGLRLLSTSADPSAAAAAAPASLLIDAESLGVEVVPDMAVNFVFELSLGWRGDQLGIDLEYLHDVGSDEYTKRAAFSWEPGDKVHRIERPVAFDGGLTLLREGARYFAPPVTGLTLEGRTLVVDGRDAPIELGRAYDQIFGDPAGRYALVLDQRHRMLDAIRMTQHNDTTVARVDLETGAVETIAKGGGSGWVAVGPEGALYVETGGTTRRFASIAAATPGTEGEPIMEGVHLTMPMDDPFCENCG